MVMLPLYKKCQMESVIETYVIETHSNPPTLPPPPTHRPGIVYVSTISSVIMLI